MSDRHPASDVMPYILEEFEAKVTYADYYFRGDYWTISINTPHCYIKLMELASMWTCLHFHASCALSNEYFDSKHFVWYLRQISEVMYVYSSEPLV